MILVSACLLGINCKYSGGNNENKELMKFLEKEKIIPVCPEQLGGLSTPREPCEIVEKTGNLRVVDIKGKDQTLKFLKGAEETLKIAQLCVIEEAVLKSNSPSCGSFKIYDGSFTGKLIDGEGITASLLKSNNIKVYNEINYIEKLK
jgi:uncharacterized protein YbbK (DUF523 family)